MFLGEFRQGLPHGKGIKTFADGATLKGTFIAAAPEGTAGICKWPRKLKGEYRGGERAGKGELHAQSGGTIMGSLRGQISRRGRSDRS